MTKRIKVITLLVLGITILCACEMSEQIQSNLIEESNKNYLTTETSSKKKELIYCDTMQEAIKSVDSDFFIENPYMSNVDEIVKIVENEKSALLFYRAYFNEKEEAFMVCKFVKENMEGEKKYALQVLEPMQITKGAFHIGTPLDIIKSNLALSDYKLDMSIDYENMRVAWGICRSDKIYTLLVENQAPTDIIEMDVFGKKEYFWFYENIESNKSGSELEVTMDEEDSKKNKKEEEVKPKIVLP